MSLLSEEILLKVYTLYTNLLITDVTCCIVAWFFHSSETEYLQQMILHHIPTIEHVDLLC